MRILVINSGSSSLKFDLLDAAETKTTRLAHGLIDRIGDEHTSAIEFTAAAGEEEKREAAVKDHHEAVALVLDWLRATSKRDAALKGDIEAVGHRVVHGGDHFVAPTLVDDGVLAALDKLSELAPLH